MFILLNNDPTRRVLRREGRERERGGDNFPNFPFVVSEERNNSAYMPTARRGARLALAHPRARMVRVDLWGISPLPPSLPISQRSSPLLR